MNEWDLLKSICVRDPAAGLPGEGLPEALARMSWGELMEQAVRHKVTPLIVWELLRAAPERIPQQIRIHLRTVLAANTYRTKLLTEAAAEVQHVFESHDIRACAVKGAIFAGTIYPEPGTRLMNDIDFMVAPSDRERAQAALEGCGFSVAEFDPASTALRPYTRRELVFYRLNPDHLPIMTRLTGDIVVPALRVDVAYSLTWAGAPWQVATEEALAGSGTLAAPTGPIRCMRPEYQFAHTALHLFREAWLERWLETGQDVNLAKFTDLYRLWYRWRDELAGRLARLAATTTIGEPLAWVLAHGDRSFGTDLLRELRLTRFLNEEFLHSVCGADGKRLTWDGDMEQRLRAKDRGYVFRKPGSPSTEPAP